MNNKRCLVFLVLFGCFFIHGLSVASARAEDLTPLLNKISKRMNSYPENNNIQYKFVETYTEMDKKWRPKKTRVTKEIRKVVDGIPSGEILEAVEIEDGVTKDIKQEVIEQYKRIVERDNKFRAERKEKKENEFDELIPFNEKRRAGFEFKRLNDDTLYERPVFVIETVAKEKDIDLFEGKYYIDKKTYDVLKAQLKPPKKPKLVKEMSMEVEFQVLPEGNFMLKRVKARVDAGLLFVRLRAIEEEEYFDVKILDSKM